MDTLQYSASHLILFTIGCAIIYLVIHVLNDKYAKLFALFLVAIFFSYAWNILTFIIQEMAAIFIAFEGQRELLQLVVELVTLVFFAEFVSSFLADAGGDLKNVAKAFEYIIKLQLIIRSLPLIRTLFELIQTII